MTKIEPETRQFRFYRMDIVQGLFGEWSLVREWGRIGRGGQIKTDRFDNEEDAKDARFDLHMEKAKRGFE